MGPYRASSRRVSGSSVLTPISSRAVRYHCCRCPVQSQGRTSLRPKRFALPPAFDCFALTRSITQDSLYAGTFLLHCHNPASECMLVAVEPSGSFSWHHIKEMQPWAPYP